MSFISFFINTATPQVQLALFKGADLGAEKSWESRQNEAEKVQLETDLLLQEQGLNPDQVDRLMVCRGPGGFTSTRIGISAINAWAFAKDLPVAVVNVFDLYEQDESIFFLTANPSETWMKKPEEEPAFVKREGLELDSPFSFTGIVNEDWKAFLEEQGGQWFEPTFRLPNPEELEFKKEIVKPWYYKEASITVKAS